MALRVEYGWSSALGGCMEPPSNTHWGDVMFTVPEEVNGTLWHVAYEGRVVTNEAGFQELEQLWEVGIHEWEPMV